jgi:hypothetical protein
LNWTIRVVLESVFPLTPLLLAPLVRWRRALAVAGIAAALVVPVQRARGEIPPPLPDWQTWSLQDIGARSVIAGDATASTWSVRVMPVLRALGLLTVASFIVVIARGSFARPRWSRGHMLVLMHALLLIAAIHALWLYNDRYYVVLSAPGAMIAASAFDGDRRAQWAAAALLVVWAGIAVTGTRDLLGFNDACDREARRLEASGVPAYEIDAGYPLNGWRLYAHPEHLPPGADPRYDVPFVTSDRTTPFAIMSHPTPGTDVIRVVPLPRATWQATREIYVVKRHE